MPLGILTLHLRLPGCSSLKEKRSRIKPLLARLHKEFNVSTSEMDLQDAWQESLIACAWIGSDQKTVQRSLQKVSEWVEKNWPDMLVEDDRIEMI
jgi:uncharacterized protein YlxP (DUF503 family)